MKKVLLVCFDNLGDLVFASSLAQALTQDPHYQISLWCKDYTSRIGHFLPGVEQVFASDPFWNKAPRQRRGSIRIFLRCWRTVRRGRFDIALIPSTCWRTAIFVKMAGIPQRWGLLGRRNRRFLTRTFPAPHRDTPVTIGLLEAFAEVLPRHATRMTYLERSRLPRLALPEPLVARQLVVLHAFAGRADRCAPLSIWMWLADWLKHQGYFVLWTGTKQELDEIRQARPHDDPNHYIDRWTQDLQQLAWVWAQARLFIGHDSGPLHVAHALGVPVVGLYLPGEPKRTFPQGPASSLMIHEARPADLTTQRLQAELLSFLAQIAIESTSKPTERT